MTKSKREIIWKKYDKRCAYCGCELEYKDMQVDHIFPKRRHEIAKMDMAYLDEEDNLNPSCRQCNFYKSDFLLEEFREQMKTLHERVMKPFLVRLAMKYEILEYKEWDGKFYFEKQKELCKQKTRA